MAIRVGSTPGIWWTAATSASRSATDDVFIPFHVGPCWQLISSEFGGGPSAWNQQPAIAMKPCAAYRCARSS